MAHPESKITPPIPLVKTAVAALKTYPVFNTSLGADSKTLFWKQYFHIGVAIDTPNGLPVPAIRDCDSKSSAALAMEITAISGKARAKGLSMAEMSGGGFTI